MLKTRSGLPKHCTWHKDRNGKRRVRFRRRSVSVYLTGIPWSEEFMRQYAAALEADQEQRSQVGASLRSLPGSFSALCASYYGSPEFRGLKASTQRVRRNILEHFRTEHGHRLVKDLRIAHIRTIIGNKSSKPEAANNLLKILRVVLNFAVAEGMIAGNPALVVKRYKQRGEGVHTWSENEVVQFEVRHPIGSKARLALELLLSTGQRRSDVVKMGWQHVQRIDGEDWITVRQEKTDEPLLIPIDAPLATVLSVLPRTNMTFLVTEFGKPFTAPGFGNWFRRRCNEASLPQCSAHGLRKLAATRLANAGCSSEMIKAITGHRSDSALAPYIRKANKAKLAREAKAMVRAKTRTDLPNIRTHVYPTAKK
jgi:integrase